MSKKQIVFFAGVLGVGLLVAAYKWFHPSVRTIGNGALVDEVAVLTVCLDQLSIGHRQVVSSETRTSGSEVTVPGLQQIFTRENLAVHSETIADFLTKNRAPHPVHPDFTLGRRLRVLTEKERERIFRDGPGSDWVRLSDVFPETDGILSFSRVGFNADVTQALMEECIVRGPMEGRANYWLFTQEKGRWKAVGRVRYKRF